MFKDHLVYDYWSEVSLAIYTIIDQIARIQTLSSIEVILVTIHPADPTSIHVGGRRCTVLLNCTAQATFLNAIILHSISEFEKRTCSDVTLLFLDSFFVQHAGAVVFGSMPKNGGLCPPPRAWPQSKRFAASEGLGSLVLVARQRRLRVWVDKARVIIFFNRRRGDFVGLIRFRYLC